MTRVRVFETFELLRARYTRQRFAPHAHAEFVFGVSRLAPRGRSSAAPRTSMRPGP